MEGKFYYAALVNGDQAGKGHSPGLEGSLDLEQLPRTKGRLSISKGLDSLGD